MADTKQLATRLESLLEGGGAPQEIELLLVSNSNLPGPRGNLELADAFARCFERIDLRASLWEMLLGWIAIAEADAPTGNPREFLPFCALQALGAGYPEVDGERKHRIVELIKRAARDGRWRVREGAAMAFQRIGEKDFGALSTVFSRWMEGASLLEQRAIVAALAHPPFLGERENARYSLEVSDRILRGLVELDMETRRSEPFRVLRQGLEYAISVFVAALPEEGFALLRRWAVVNDRDVKRIVKSNLGKGRLAKRYPEQVAEAMALL
jgi:hypothetical protein